MDSDQAGTVPKKNVFVLGLDDLNLELMATLPNADGCEFHRLFTIEQLQHGDDIPIAELIEEASARLEAFDGSIDAIVGYWDFPVSSMVPILCRRFGLRSSSLEARLRCEHKYWARLEQRAVIDEHPRFAALDPFDDDAVAAIPLPYPFWIKPVKGFSSELAHRVTSDDELDEAIGHIREAVGRVGGPFEYVMSQAQGVPAQVAELGGRACVVEEALEGQQCTVEGYRSGGRAHVYGLFDSVKYPQASSFLRYEYPSRVPAPLQERMADVSRRVIDHVDLDESTFNVEFIWDDERVTVLEVNPRHSQSHAPLLTYVDGIPNHKLMLDLALGQEPSMPRRQGEYACAAKWFLREFRDDGIVARAPTAEEVRAVEGAVSGTTIEVLVADGDRLSELHDQDAYSYKLAEIFVGAHDQGELDDKYRRCLEGLEFRIDEVS